MTKLTTGTAALFLATSLSHLQASDKQWQMDIAPHTWNISGFENDLDLSGIATSNGTHILVASDESFYIQPGKISSSDSRINPDPPIPLTDINREDTELDLEGVAFSASENTYYTTGSHGLAKKKGDFQSDRYSVFRLAADPKTGATIPTTIERTSLLPWLKKTPLLKPHLDLALQKNGLNIEGLAVVDRTLFFGLRAPNKNGEGFVIEISADSLFEQKPRALKLHRLALASGRGIREITAVDDGFLIITGSASAKASKTIPVSHTRNPAHRFDLLHWDGTSRTPTRIGTLPDTGGKAEALLVLRDNPEFLSLLVIHDSLPGGGPIAINLTRPRS